MKEIPCPKCGAMIPVNGLGRKPYDIPVNNIYNALRKHRGNYHRTAKTLSEEFGINVSPGFVKNRVDKSGKTLLGILGQQ